MRQTLQTLQLALGLLANLFGKVCRAESLAQHVGLGALAALVFSEFLLYGLHLLAQEVVALRLRHLALRLLGYLRAKLHDFDFARETLVGDLQKLVNGVGFEHLLFLLDAEVEYGAEEVGELRRLVRRHHGGSDFGRYLRQHRERALDERLKVSHQRLDRLVVALDGRREYARARAYVRVYLRPLDDAHALRAVDYELKTFWGAHHALYHDERADAVEIVGRRGLAFGAALAFGHGDAGQKFLFGRERGLDRGDRARAARGERDDRAGKKRRLLQR